MFIFAVIAISIFFSGCIDIPQHPINASVMEASELKSFSSWDEISDFLKSTRYGYTSGNRKVFLTNSEALLSIPTASKGAADYSQTNVQVEGVDEADIVKNDGKYIYTLSSGNVIIVEAYPPQTMKSVSKITFNGTAEQLFVYKDKLVVFGANDYDYSSFITRESMLRCIAPRCIPSPDSQLSFVNVYDISNRSKPVLEKAIDVRGNYVQSRMINGKVYVIFQDYPYYIYPAPTYYVNGEQREISPGEIKFFDAPDESFVYTLFISVDLNNVSANETKKIILMGNSQTVYVSHENIYITRTVYDSYIQKWNSYKDIYSKVFAPEVQKRINKIDSMNISDWRKDRLKVAELADFVQNSNDSELKTMLNLEYEFTRPDVQRPAQLTVISKIALENFTYIAKGEVPGYVLNQFSMDEYEGNFRIATTLGDFSTNSMSGVYVLDKELDITGKIEKIAPGESIYSVRFMGKRAYMVTFKKIDPFFVLDLSDPENPKLLGKLKIPGYSDYLHPYDENYIIGLGKEAIPAKEGNFAWYQGVKLSLFDVHNVSNPKEVAKFEIGDRGTDSYALHDSKAFLFSKSRNLLIIPILLAELDKSKYAEEVQPSAYGDYTFQGAYVFHISPEYGFLLRGKISHTDEEELLKSGEYFYSDAAVKRSAYMDEYLYTISEKFVKANKISDISEIAFVDLSRLEFIEGNLFNGTYIQPYKMKECTSKTYCSGSVQNVIDGNFSTNWYPADWEANVLIEYGKPVEGDYQIGFQWNGDGYDPNCTGDIYISEDGEIWTKIIENKSALIPQYYFGNTSFKYLKTQFPSPSYGTCGWVSLNEIQVIQIQRLRN